MRDKGNKMQIGNNIPAFKGIIEVKANTAQNLSNAVKSIAAELEQRPDLTEGQAPWFLLNKNLDQPSHIVYGKEDRETLKMFERCGVDVAKKAQELAHYTVDADGKKLYARKIIKKTETARK